MHPLKISSNFLQFKNLYKSNLTTKFKLFLNYKVTKITSEATNYITDNRVTPHTTLKSRTVTATTTTTTSTSIYILPGQLETSMQMNPIPKLILNSSSLSLFDFIPPYIYFHLFSALLLIALNPFETCKD